jgi:hypothetical protein
VPRFSHPYIDNELIYSSLDKTLVGFQSVGHDKNYVLSGFDKDEYLRNEGEGALFHRI